MPHVSRHTPIRKVADQTFDLFMQCVTTKWSSLERQAFFNELLTPTERVMFSKRLAVVYMLAKGYTFEDIQETLRVSPSTIARVWKAIAQGKYTEVIKRIEKKTRNDFDAVQWFLTLMPPAHVTKKEYARRMRRLNL